MTLKKDLLRYCKEFANERIGRIQKNIKDIEVSLTAETKSSAGDKHETGRAMLQLEREKLGHQLAQAEKMNQVLAKVPAKNNNSVVALGSLVKTSKADYFIAISAGEFNHGKQQVYCISAESPIGKLLMGKSLGTILNFNAEEIIISKIL
jgi:transcription elongation GreA/GreB family factor